MKTATRMTAIFALMLVSLIAGCGNAMTGSTLGSSLPGKWNGRVSIYRPDGIALIAIFKTQVVKKSASDVRFSFEVSELDGYSLKHITYAVQLDPKGPGKGIVASIRVDDADIISRIVLAPAKSQVYSGERTTDGATEKAAVSILDNGDVKMEFHTERPNQQPYDVIVTLTKKESKL